ncbi:MAG: formate dehydrogenase subunit alpha [Halofilum sp. (in: g-proteobacteria)]|nr:formate dehydrogenase subunit alpha [Halofilum sp. (in: g-proteobacteria)]
MAARSDQLFETVAFTLDGREIEAFEGETILEAAERHGHGGHIPRLCYTPGQRAVGNCRSCMVEIEGERVLAPSCWRVPRAGMVVRSTSERAVAAQKMVLELLQSDMPAQEYSRDNELGHWVERLGVTAPRFEGREQPAADLSHPAMAVNLDACIQCTRCVRACREEQVNDVIGFAGRGDHAQIVFDLDDPMGQSSCVGCGECVQACPTGALMPANGVGLEVEDRKVDSVCPYCGVGCLLRYNVKDNAILHIEGRDGPSNHERLCVKGRFGFDYVSHPNRLTKPLIRREGVPKALDDDFDPARSEEIFREATWEEALDAAAAGLKRIRDEHGGQALAGFGSAKGSNEEAYLFQKLVRTGFRTNNVDHCTRLCHASSVAALIEGIGSGGVTCQVADVADCEVMFVIGANPTSNHPVAATFMKNEAEKGKYLIVADPRRIELSRHSTHSLQFKSDTDVALLNAMLHAVIDEGLVDEAFVAERTEGFEELRRNVMDGYSPEEMAPVCGIDAETIRECARLIATRRSIIFWGMGISQHIHGTDNSRCLIALALLTGNVGRAGSGLHPLRGQNNVQGASDAGLIPMVYPDYQPVGNAQVREWFERFWGVEGLDPEPGLTVVEIMNTIHAGKLHGMYIMGENPAMSDPNLNHARESLAMLDHLVVQDLFLTETAAYADIVLPASAFPEKTGTFTNTDRRVQLGRVALEMPGSARQDWTLIQEIARRIGLDWEYGDISEVYEEMRQTMPSITGITWDRLQANDSVTYPCRSRDDPGQGLVFADGFPTASGRAKLVPAHLISADETPDDQYPYVFITGRQLEHWHTGSMTRRSSVLNAIEPDPVASMHPLDMYELGVTQGDPIRIESRRGEVNAYARGDDGMQRGEVYLPFAFHEAAANLLTNEAIDPFGKIPEFKYCAVRVSVGAEVPERVY